MDTPVDIAKSLGADCAELALANCDSQDWATLLPREPLPGDFELLDVFFTAESRAEASKLFTLAYAERIERALRDGQ